MCVFVHRESLPAASATATSCRGDSGGPSSGVRSGISEASSLSTGSIPGHVSEVPGGRDDCHQADEWTTDVAHCWRSLLLVVSNSLARSLARVSRLQNLLPKVHCMRETVVIWNMWRFCTSAAIISETVQGKANLLPHRLETYFKSVIGSQWNGA